MQSLSVSPFLLPDLVVGSGSDSAVGSELGSGSASAFGSELGSGSALPLGVLSFLLFAFSRAEGSELGGSEDGSEVGSPVQQN